MNTGAQQIRSALRTFLTTTDGLIVGENVGRGGGIGGCSEGLLNEHPDRVIEVPIGDRSALGLALGLALAGRPVVVELSSTRALLPLANLLTDAARFQASPFAPAITIRVPCDQGAGPLLDGAIGGMLTTIPDLTVHTARAETIAHVLQSALGKGLHVVLETADTYERRAQPLTPSPAHVLRDGRHLCIATWGEGVDAALAAAESLASEGIDAQVLELVQLHPVPDELAEQVCASGRLLVVHASDPSFLAAVHQKALQGAFLYLESPLAGCAPHSRAVVDAARSCVLY